MLKYRGHYYAELRPSLVGKGAGRFSVYSSLVYLSRTAHRGHSPETDVIQDLIEALKRGDPAAIQEGAQQLATHPGLRGFKGVVVPAPRSSDQRPSNLQLAKALVQQGVGTTALDLITRIKPVPSSRQLRHERGRGLPYSEHIQSLEAELPESADGVLIVDDIFTTGATILAAAETLRQAGYTGPVFGAAVGYYSAEPVERGVQHEVFYV